MSIASFDLEIQAFIRLGLDFIQAHTDEAIEEIFGNLKSDHMKNIYGDKEIKKIKQWILENDIPVVNAWSLNPQRVPCFSVHIAQTTEDTSHAFLGDHGGIKEVEKIPRTIVEQFVPISYDPLTNEVFCPNTVNLGASLVRPAHIMHDAAGVKFEITDVVNATTFIIRAGATEPDLRNVTIKSFIERTIHKEGQSYFQEQVDIGIHGHADSNTVLWMYYIAAWVFLRFKPEMEKRCMDLITWSATDFKRDSQYLGENIFSRWMRVSARTQSTWTEDPYDEIDTIVANVGLVDIDDL